MKWNGMEYMKGTANGLKSIKGWANDVCEINVCDKRNNEITFISGSTEILWIK